jgi:quercetin dioxygenase-like cupin family protein
MAERGQIRRVVTGHDDQGKAVVISDGFAPTVRTNPLRPGHISVDLWRTGAAPVILKKDEPDPTLGPRQIHPGPMGTVFRISEVAPETDAIRNMTPEQAREAFRTQGSEAASTFGRGGRHPLMHRTQTVDYAVVLDGEIYLVLDDTEVLLRTGDVVIQRGTNHAWSNRSDRPCVIAFSSHDGSF